MFYLFPCGIVSSGICDTLAQTGLLSFPQSLNLNWIFQNMFFPQQFTPENAELFLIHFHIKDMRDFF